MRCSHCGLCCAETEMLLSNDDVKRIEKRGFHKKYFMKISKDGYVQLRNYNGYCAFYSLEEHRCIIYSDKPSGCGVYPVILDEDVGIIIDDICPERGSVTFEERQAKGQVVIKLLEVIDAEAAVRC
ncbi:MAG: YkgJ family cysteine cluster protein [Nitrososphaerota archaeon]|jgi:Fe-S-cluster containining protein|nr:YkgJ family cysteine cluster protein [Nitrososphaerota archaeon]